MVITDMSKKYEVDEHNLKEALDRLSSKESLLFTMSGKMGAGKDTIGDTISHYLTVNNHFTLVSTSFGKLIREEATTVVNGYRKSEDKDVYAIRVGVDLEDLERLSTLLKDCSVYDRTEEARVALQFWGTEVRRKQKDNYWISKMAAFIVDQVNKGISVNITDARFPNETGLVEDLLGKVIRLEVPEDIRVKRVEDRDNIKVDLDSLKHISETALDDYTFDEVFDNTQDPKVVATKGTIYILK